MLCLPALTPVANDAHAVGDSGECVVCSAENPPCFASAAMWGSLPSAIHFPSSAGSIPSNPRMTIFLSYFDGARGAEPEHAAANAATTRAPARTLFIRWRNYTAAPSNLEPPAFAEGYGGPAHLEPPGFAEGHGGPARLAPRASRERGTLSL